MHKEVLSFVELADAEHSWPNTYSDSVLCTCLYVTLPQRIYDRLDCKNCCANRNLHTYLITYALMWATKHKSGVITLYIHSNDSPETLPKSRIVRVELFFARTDGRVIIQSAVFIAKILPLEWRDVSCMPFHAVQQCVADACHGLWRRRLLAVVAHSLVARLQHDTIVYDALYFIVII